jgi:hypothetical protein
VTLAKDGFVQMAERGRPLKMAVSALSMGAGRDLFGLKKDGSEFARSR